jgi:hypothetical protein
VGGCESGGGSALVDVSGLEGGGWMGDDDELGTSIGECVGVGESVLERRVGWEARSHDPTPLPRLMRITVPISLSNLFLPSIPTSWNRFLHV